LKLRKQKTVDGSTLVERKSWWILGLAIFVIVCFGLTVPGLYLGLIRSGFLGDHVPTGQTALLTGLIGLTVLFCLYMLNQQAQLVRMRRKMHQDEMELEESRGRLAEVTSLFQLGTTLHMDLPLETIAEITVRRIASSLHCQDVSLFLVQPETRSLVCKASFGLTQRAVEPDVPFGAGALGWAAGHREPILMRAGEKEARFAAFFESHADAGSVLLLPVTVERRCIAVIQASRSNTAEPFRLEHRDIGQLFADSVAPVVDRAQATQRLKQAEAAAGTAPSPMEESASGAFRDVFLTAVGTELKSPLTTIVAYSEVLDQNEGKMTPAMRREFSARLKDEGARMMALVDDVLDLVRLELGRYLLDLRLANVNQIARSAVESVKPLAETKGVALDLDLDGSIPDQHVDPAKLRQAVLHLLRNAIRFTPGRTRVRLTTLLSNDGVRIEVKDAGPAVPPEASNAVFELESLGEEYGKRCKDGRGFGLHLTRRFVELHGGQVGAGTSTDGGATFWIRLPRGEDLSSLIGSDPFLEEIAKS